MPEAEDVLDLGDSHRIVFVEFEGQSRVGGDVYHPCVGGKESYGWISFEGRAWANSFGGKLESWKVECEDPFTISPSVLCRVCGDHGHIRNGRWERA